MCRPGERGIVLLAAVSALAVMSILAVGFAHTSALDQHRVRHALAALQAEALARSGVAAAAVMLGEASTSGTPDSPRSPWARELGRQPLGEGWVEVRIEDEARRLDLNAPELAAALPRLLALLGLDPHLADAITDWTDADDAPRTHGAERDWYLGRSPARLPANGPFTTPDELGLVRGLDAAAVARLAPHVTIAGEHAVNPNTASREVLLAVLDDPGLVARLEDARRHAPLGEDELATMLESTSSAARALLTTHAQHYRVRALAGVGALRRGLEATLFAPGGLDPELSAWRPFVPASD